jgi:hypothetical protein
MTVLKLQVDESLKPGQIIMDGDVIYCRDINDFIDFMKEYNENSD